MNLQNRFGLMVLALTTLDKDQTHLYRKLRCDFGLAAKVPRPAATASQAVAVALLETLNRQSDIEEAQLHCLFWNFYQLQPLTGPRKHAETPVGAGVQVFRRAGAKTSGPETAVEPYTLNPKTLKAQAPKPLNPKPQVQILH